MPEFESKKPKPSPLRDLLAIPIGAAIFPASVFVYAFVYHFLGGSIESVSAIPGCLATIPMGLTALGISWLALRIAGRHR